MKFLKRPEVHIPLIFMGISIMWIVFSDKLLLKTTNLSAERLTEIQSIKGIFFIIAASVVIFILVKNSNKRIKRSEEEYIDLFQNNPEAMWVYNSESLKFCTYNKATIERYGYSDLELQSLTVNDLYPNNQESFKDSKAIAELFNQGFVKHISKDGRVLFCEETVRNIMFKNAAACLVAAHDVTDLVYAKADLIEHEKQLNKILASIELREKHIEEQNQKLKEIAFLSSHTMRAPLTNILGLAEVLDKDDPLSEVNKRIIENIKTSAKQLDEVIIHLVQQTVHLD
jgi:PAS domain S-box-containing protein